MGEVGQEGDLGALAGSTMALDHDSWLLLYAAPGLGVVTSNATFVSPLAHVRRARASGDFSSINAAPFAAIVANCMGWCAYAFGTRDWFVFWSNAPGVLLGLFFVSSAMQHTKCSSLLARLERQLLVQTAVTLVGGAVAAIALRDADRAMSVLGAVAVFHLLVFYSAPLSDVVNILKQRDSSSLLWPLIATSAVNGLLWVSAPRFEWRACVCRCLSVQSPLTCTCARAGGVWARTV